MKIFRRALSLIISVAMLTAMIPDALAESDKIFTIQNDYVKYSINSETGGFSVETLDGNPQKELDDNIPLLYKEDEDRSNGTSFTTIRIDGKDYIFGRSYGFFGIDTVLSTPVISEGGRLISVDWKIKDYTVTQQVALSAEKDNDLTGNVGISYVVKNNGTSSAPVGIRVLMDSALGSTVDSPYLIKDTDALPIDVETEYSGENMPTQIRGVDSLEDPTKMMYTFLKGWNTETEIDRVVVGHWRNLANTRYDYTPDNYCNFTNYSNKYRFPDSAIAYYWDEEALAPGAEKTAELLYGVGNFSSGLGEDNLGIYMSIDNKVRLNEAGDGYANNGEFEITVTVDNSVDNAQKITDTNVVVELDEGLSFQEGYGSVTVYDNLEVGDIHTIKYKLKAEPQTKISAKSIAVSLHGSQDIDATTAKAVNYGTARSVLLPSVTGTLPEIKMSNITPGTVYTEGTKSVTVSGEMAELQALEATDMWDLYLVHTTSDSKVRIEKDRIAFTDDTYSAFTFSTDETLVVGEYELVFEFTDTQLTQQFGVTSIKAAQKLEVSNDTKYKLRSYGLMALVRHKRNQYAFVAFNDEKEYNSFLAGERVFYDINGKAVDKHDYAEMKTDTNEVILLIRGDIRESYWLKADGSKQYYYQANPEDADVIINDILKYTGDEPIMIREDGGIYKVSGDGKLSVINSITVWRDEWSFQTVKGQVTTLDSGRYGAEDCTALNLQLDGVGNVVQSIGGFLIDIKYGEMSASRLVEDDRTFAYGIGFGGRISIPIKAPDNKSKKDDAKEQVLSEDDKNISKDKIIDKPNSVPDDDSGSGSASGGVGSGNGSTDAQPGEDEEDYSDALQNLFKEEESATPTQTGTTNTGTSAPAKKSDKFRKDTSLDEGGLTADLEEVRFGQITGEKDDMVVIEDVGFVGINTTLSLCLPKDVLGSLVTNAPGVYAAVTINTLEDIYAVAAGLDIKAIQCEGLLSFKKTEIKNVELVVPDNIEFYIRDGLEIPLVPGVLHIGGLGGGINDLADTMGGEFTKLPPITLLLFIRLEAVQVFAGDFDASISLSGISLDGELEIDTKDTLPSPVVINAGISARWIDPIHFKVYGQINIIDGLISGGVSITITDKSFCGYVFAAICIPDSIPIIGGYELAKVEAAIGTDYVGAAVKIIGIKIGVIYYWDGDLALGKGVSLSSYNDEVDPENTDALAEADMASGQAHALYGTNLRTLKGAPVNNGEVSLFGDGTVLSYDFSVSEQDAVIFEIPFEGYVLPSTADFTLKNPNGVEIPLVEADDEGNGNFIVQTGREDGYFAYISVTDENQLVDGVWTLTINNSDIEVSEIGGYMVDDIAGLESVTASYTEPYTLDVSWTTDAEADNAGYLDVYLTKDKDIFSKLETNDMDTVIGENIGRIRLDSVKSGSETITIPDSMASGDYYVALDLSSDLGGMSTAMSTSSFKFTNDKLPKPVKSASLRYGGNGDIYVDIEDADDADYTHYLVNVVAKDGTTLTNCMDQFTKGEKVFIGSEANLQADKEYYVEVQTLKEDGEKFYYGDEIVNSDTITMRAVDKPVLLSVETNVPENGIMGENMLEVKYTFDRPVWLLGDINGDTVTERCFQEVWEISYPLIDGDYIVDFEAIGMNKDYVSAKDFEATVENARLGFVVDTIAPTLALKKNVFTSLKKEENKAVETLFGSNVVIADENGDFTVEGVSEFKATLTVDGSETVSVNADGTFTYSANLGDAQQREMLFKAVDKSGNETTLTVYAISKNQSLIKSIEILNNGEAVTKNSDGEAVITLKKGESANLSVRGITQDGNAVTLADDNLLWEILYEKNLINLADGVVTAVGAGESVVKVGLPTGEVTLLDDTSVDTAIENYVIFSIMAYDKTDLAAEIALAEENIKVTGNASAEAVEDYQNAINSAKAVYADASAAADKVENAVVALKRATEIFNEAKNTVVIDKSALEAEIAAAEENIQVVGNATEADVSAYQTAIDTAKAVYTNAEATQTDVDNAVTALKNATDVFNEKKNAVVGDTVNKAGLEAEIAAAEENIKVVGNATEEDVSAYQTAIDTAKAVYANAEATQADVNNAVSALKNATKVFNEAKNKVVGDTVDKTNLAEEIEEAEENIADVKKADKKAVEAYQKAIDTAKAVYADDEATQADVDNAVTQLKNATKAFDKKNDAVSSAGGVNGGGSVGGSGGMVIVGGNITGYDITVNAGVGGSASASQYKAPLGNSVTITSVANDGYEIDKVTVNGEYYGNDEIITIASVKGDTTVDVTFRRQWINPFKDVMSSDWFYENVKWANRNGFMNGTESDMFSPDNAVTRAMLVTILYRAEGEPEVSGMSNFADVNNTDYYAKAVAWAEANGIVNGYSDTEFAPDDNVLREQIAAILYRYASYKGYDVSADADITSYDDSAAVSEYAREAVEWAVGMGIISGKSEKTIAPVDNATRAEVAAMMQRFEGNIK